MVGFALLAAGVAMLPSRSLRSHASAPRRESLLVDIAYTYTACHGDPVVYNACIFAFFGLGKILMLISLICAALYVRWSYAVTRSRPQLMTGAASL